MRYKLSSRVIGIVAILVVSLSANAQNERLRYGITFDGKTIDTLFSANGGWPLLTFKTGSSGLGYVQKQISDTLSASEVSIQIGANPSAMFDWIKSSFDHSNGFRS